MSSGEFPVDPRDFAAYYAFAPAALAIRECARLRAVRKIELPEPILDVGCGDGVFARLAYPEKQVWGIDINPTEVRRAQATASYSTLLCGNICEVALPPSFFGSAIANCSLEHVPDVEKAITNMRRSMQRDAPMALIVPAPDWSRQLATAETLRHVGLGRLADAYGDALDRIFAHVHLLDVDGWTRVLERCGLSRVEAIPIVDRATSWAFDVLLYPSAVGWLTKRITGRWVVAPGLRAVSEPIARAMVDAVGALAPAGERPGEYLLVARVDG